MPCQGQLRAGGTVNSRQDTFFEKSIELTSNVSRANLQKNTGTYRTDVHHGTVSLGFKLLSCCRLLNAGAH